MRRRRPRHCQREGGPQRYYRNRHRLNLIHANNTTIASPRRQRLHRAHDGPTHHTERGRSHAPIVVNLDDAIIVTCGDAQQPPCSHQLRDSRIRLRRSFSCTALCFRRGVPGSNEWRKTPPFGHGATARLLGTAGGVLGAIASVKVCDFDVLAVTWMLVESPL